MICNIVVIRLYLKLSSLIFVFIRFWYNILHKNLYILAVEISTFYTRCRLHVTQDFVQECTQNFKHTYYKTNVLRYWIPKVALHFFERTCIDTRSRLNMRFVTFACNVKGWPRLSYPLVTDLAKYHREKHAWYARFGRVSNAKQDENVFQKKPEEWNGMCLFLEF